MQPTVSDIEKVKAMKSMYIQKKPRRREENQIKCERKKYIVESLYKSGTRCGESSQARYTLSCLIQP